MNGIDFFVDTNVLITISLKQKYSVKIPDAIIAATAKSFELPLITADVNLKKVAGVDIVLLNL
ncbi:MAG: PIN domain-containing protein [Bacteroidales bacterium]|nr:PIN domain-containing protein [Bacteroidales bacterium]